MAALDRAHAHVVLAGLCLGLAGADLARIGLLIALVAALLAAAGAIAVRGPGQTLALAALLLVLGLGWGGLRLAALDRSVLVRFVGHADSALVEVTGPPGAESTGCGCPPARSASATAV